MSEHYKHTPLFTPPENKASSQNPPLTYPHTIPYPALTTHTHGTFSPMIAHMNNSLNGYYFNNQLPFKPPHPQQSFPLLFSSKSEHFSVKKDNENVPFEDGGKIILDISHPCIPETSTPWKIDYNSSDKIVTATLSHKVTPIKIEMRFVFTNDNTKTDLYFDIREAKFLNNQIHLSIAFPRCKEEKTDIVVSANALIKFMGNHQKTPVSMNSSHYQFTRIRKKVNLLDMIIGSKKGTYSPQFDVLTIPVELKTNDCETYKFEKTFEREGFFGCKLSFYNNEYLISGEKIFIALPKKYTVEFNYKKIRTCMIDLIHATLMLTYDDSDQPFKWFIKGDTQSHVFKNRCVIGRDQCRNVVKTKSELDGISRVFISVDTDEENGIWYITNWSEKLDVAMMVNKYPFPASYDKELWVYSSEKKYLKLTMTKDSTRNENKHF